MKIKDKEIKEYFTKNLEGINEANREEGRFREVTVEEVEGYAEETIEEINRGIISSVFSSEGVEYKDFLRFLHNRHLEGDRRIMEDVLHLYKEDSKGNLENYLEWIKNGIMDDERIGVKEIDYTKEAQQSQIVGRGKWLLILIILIIVIDIIYNIFL